MMFMMPPTKSDIDAIAARGPDITLVVLVAARPISVWLRTLRGAGGDHEIQLKDGTRLRVSRSRRKDLRNGSALTEPIGPIDRLFVSRARDGPLSARAPGRGGQLMTDD